MFQLDAKVAFITGGGSGIGRATAERFIAAGATVVIADIVDPSAVAAEIGAHAATLDVTDAAAVATAFEDVVDRHGRLDILVNNAGIIGPATGLLTDSIEGTMGVLDVNLMGVLHGMKSGARLMDSGSVIVNTASMAGMVGFPGLSAYGMSKWGVVGLTKHAAVELGPKGIRVNAVCPTGVDTPLVGDESADHWAVRSQSLANQHVDRLAFPGEVAAAIHFLASDDAMMINGHALPVDGGMGAGLSVQLIEAATMQSTRDGDAFQ
jgi:3alpha(or 20beta)-hydroxysteroid dehydrogenase